MEVVKWTIISWNVGITKSIIILNSVLREVLRDLLRDVQDATQYKKLLVAIFNYLIRIFGVFNFFYRDQGLLTYKNDNKKWTYYN